MESTADKLIRVSVYLPIGLLSALCFIGDLAGAVYWVAAGHIWAAIGSLFIPLFGAVTVINQVIVV